MALIDQRLLGNIIIDNVYVTGYNGLVVGTGKDPLSMKITLQEQLTSLLTNYIGNLSPDTKLPSERRLADKYELSRNTVRAALMELEITGKVRRIHGKGTFVNKMDPNSDLGSGYRFSKQMSLLGKKPQTKILSFERTEVDDRYFQNLDVDLGREIIKITRLHLADGLPMILERSFLPVDRFKLLTRKMITGKSLYRVFADEFDEKVKYADEYFLSGIVNNNDAKILELNEGDPCLNIRRKTYNQRNQIIEFSLSVARSDQFTYHVRHDINYE